jgi:hypothetical protein
MAEWNNTLRPLYAAAIQEARASGDQGAMRALADRAEREGADDPEVQSALAELRAELKRTPPQALYGVALHQARAAGDVSRMRALAEEAEGSSDPEIQSALAAVRDELSRQQS